MRFRFIILVLLALLMTAGFAGAVSAADFDPNITSFSASVKSGTVPLSVTFSWSATNATSYNIDYKDGDSSINLKDTNSKSHTFEKAGNYSVELKAINGTNTDTESIDIIVSPLSAPSSPELTPSNTSVDTSTSVKFTFSATGATAYILNYGDGSSPYSGSGTSATHTYNTAGTYTASLNASNAAGSITKNVSITVSNTTITRAIITDISAPQTGNTPDKNGAVGNSDDQITIDNISWSPTVTTFANGTKYTVTITVKAKLGYQFTSRTDATISEHAATIINCTTNTLTFNYEFPATTPLISIVNLTLTAPTTGGTPVKKVSSNTTGVNYDSSSVTWSPSTTTFKAGEEYTATIKVPVSSGYTLATKPTVYLNGELVDSSDVDTNDGNLNVEYDFTDKISKIYLTITEPSAGISQPDSAKSTDELVTVKSVTWDPEASKFVQGTSYKVTINVALNTDLNYADTLSFYINNNSVSKSYNNDGTYDVSYTFTTSKEISKISVVLNAPVTRSSAPLSASIQSNPYDAVTGTVSWSPSVSTFAADTQYTANIAITAFDGFSFTSTVTATVNGETAIVKRNSDTSVTVSYTYPKTAKDTSVSAVETIVTKSNEETDTKPTNTTSIIPNPIGIIQEFVKLFLSLFNFDNYIIFGNNATAPAA